MTRKKLLLFLVCILFFLIGLVGILLFKQTRDLGDGERDNFSGKGGQIEPVEVHATDPVRMRIAADQTFVEWEADGQLVAPLEQRGDFLAGTFVLTGDKNKQQLPIYFGPQGTPVLVGRKDNSSEGAANGDLLWTKMSLDEAGTQIPVGQVIKIYFLNYIQDGSNDEVNKYRDFWQDINSQINRQGGISSYSMDEPELWLYSNKVGIGL